MTNTLLKKSAEIKAVEAAAEIQVWYPLGCIREPYSKAILSEYLAAGWHATTRGLTVFLLHPDAAYSEMQ